MRSLHVKVRAQMMHSRGGAAWLPTASGGPQGAEESREDEEPLDIDLPLY